MKLSIVRAQILHNQVRPTTFALAALIFAVAGVSALSLLVVAGLAALCAVVIAVVLSVPQSVDRQLFKLIFVTLLRLRYIGSEYSSLNQCGTQTRGRGCQ